MVYKSGDISEVDAAPTWICEAEQEEINGIKARCKESGTYPIALGQRVVECACPGHADRGTAAGVAVEAISKSTKQHKAKKVGQTLKRVQKSYIKKSISAVSSVARVRSRGSGATSTERSWTTPPASSGAGSSLSSLDRSRAWTSSHSVRTWCTPSASSPLVRAHAPLPSNGGGKQRSWCTPTATSLRKPSDARAAHRAWLEP